MRRDGRHGRDVRGHESRVHGIHAIEELLKKDRVSGTLFVARDTARTRTLVEGARRRGVAVSQVEENIVTQLSGAKRHDGVVLLFDKTRSREQSVKRSIEQLESQHALVVLLDGITDPRNLGAILRSCDQFGVDRVILPSRRSVSETSTVAAASSGTNVYVPVSIAANLNHVIAILKKNNFWVYGADTDGERLDKIELTGKIALALGGEGKGLHDLVSKNCDRLVRIPTRGHVDSLNVSVAAGILFFEIRRQQSFPGF